MPESETGVDLWGANYELALGDATTLGVTYLDVSANPAKRPLRDGLEVINARAFTAPIPGLQDLSFELEYALEDNDDLVRSEAWTAQVAYQLSGVAWQPKLTYRLRLLRGRRSGDRGERVVRPPVSRLL